jgi:hypothetical protein
MRRKERNGPGMTIESGGRLREPPSAAAESAGAAARVILQLAKQKNPAAVKARQRKRHFMARSSLRIGCDSARENGIMRAMRKLTAGGIDRCRFGPFGLPYTSEFHLYAESLRIGGLARNFEDLAGNPGVRYCQKRL